MRHEHRYTPVFIQIQVLSLVPQLLTYLDQSELYEQRIAQLIRVSHADNFQRRFSAQLPVTGDCLHTVQESSCLVFDQALVRLRAELIIDQRIAVGSIKASDITECTQRCRVTNKIPLILIFSDFVQGCVVLCNGFCSDVPSCVGHDCFIRAELLPVNKISL